MPTSRFDDRAAELRDALESAAGVPVQSVPVSRGTRVSAPAPAADDWERWRRVIAILREASDWGSSSLTGSPQIWAEIRDDEVST